MKFERIPLALVNRDAENVGGQQVAGELDALVVRADDPCHGMRECCLADAGHVLDQEVAPRQQAAERKADLLVLAQQDAVDGLLRLEQAGMSVRLLMIVRNYRTVHNPFTGAPRTPLLARAEV